MCIKILFYLSSLRFLIANSKIDPKEIVDNKTLDATTLPPQPLLGVGSGSGVGWAGLVGWGKDVFVGLGTIGVGTGTGAIGVGVGIDCCGVLFIGI